MNNYLQHLLRSGVMNSVGGAASVNPPTNCS